LYNIIKILFVILFTFSCSSLPGINNELKKQKGSKLTATSKGKSFSNYTIKDISLDIIDINELNQNELEKYNSLNFKEIKYSIKQFSNIYNYKYEYALGSADVISVNLTDTDDLDGTYIIGPNGNIDLPFVGKINVLNLTLNDTKKKVSFSLKKIL